MRRPRGRRSPLLPHINYVAALAFRPDGKVLATGDYSGVVHLWDVETGGRVRSPLFIGSIILRLAYSPDGRMLAIGTAEPLNLVVVLGHGRRLACGQAAPLQEGRSPVWPISPDGRRLAAGSDDTTVRLIDVATGRAIGEPMCHADLVRGLAFSPDGRLLLTASSGPSRNSCGSALGHGHGPARLAGIGAPASRRLGRAGVLARWHALRDGMPGRLGVCSGTRLPPRRSARPGCSGILSSPWRSAPTAGPCWRWTTAVDVDSWPVPVPSDEPVERLIRRLEVRSGLELDAAGAVVVLDAETWRRRRAELDDPPRTSNPADDLAWHEALARDAEAVGDGFAARWHLERMIPDRPGEGLLRARRARALLTGRRLRDRPDPSWPARSSSGRATASSTGSLQRAEDFRASGRPDDALLLLDQVVAAGAATTGSSTHAVPRSWPRSAAPPSARPSWTGPSGRARISHS